MIFFFFLLINIAYGFDKPCLTCKYFVENKYNPDLSLCSFFKEKIQDGKIFRTIPNFAVHCRNDEKLCGKTGFLHEPIHIRESYEYISSLCSSEFVEESDLLELDFIRKNGIVK
jgi:hypothetical protein